MHPHAGDGGELRPPHRSPQSGLYASLNVPGCIALTQGNTTCADPVGALTACEDAACASCGASSGDLMIVDACTAAADGAVCAPYTGAAKCKPTTGPCMFTTFGEGYAKIAPLFCLAP
jgi:hypothetical protein